jgi:predicted lipid-binding transport protein (Tim44 family)
MRLIHRLRGLVALLAVATTLSLVAVDFAEARRGGSFGSRGARTFQAPAATPTAPKPVAPVQQSTTPRTATETAAPRTTTAQRPGFFSGFGGTMMRGLLVGGLIGLLLGTGFGGLAGFLGLLLQIGLIALVAFFVMRMVAGARSPQPAVAGRAPPPPPPGPSAAHRAVPAAAGSGRGAAGRAGALGLPGDEIGITQGDLDRFEAMLEQIQTAHAAEDFASLRALTTDEVRAVFAEEIATRSGQGRRNEVTDVRLLQGDLSEAWAEGADEYATVALRYESVDVTRDRASGAVVDGDPDRPVESTEVWTFQRRPGGDWRLSAIQS